jgi:heptosyltransferase-2
LIAIAPGTAWNTKRWPREHFARLAQMLSDAGDRVVLIGGPEDAPLCREIAGAAGRAGVVDASGAFSVLGSAELIRRSALLVCNDSAPLHLAGAVGTPVLAIFGATTPAFGFGPIGPRDRVLETEGLACRPCSIHGGDRCPIGTFECMVRITPAMAFEAARSMAEGGAQ